jgi:hypothetical protein
MESAKLALAHKDAGQAGRQIQLKSRRIRDLKVNGSDGVPLRIGAVKSPRSATSP